MRKRKRHRAWDVFAVNGLLNMVDLDEEVNKYPPRCKATRQLNVAVEASEPWRTFKSPVKDGALWGGENRVNELSWPVRKFAENFTDFRCWNQYNDCKIILKGPWDLCFVKRISKKLGRLQVVKKTKSVIKQEVKVFLEAQGIAWDPSLEKKGKKRKIRSRILP